MPNVRQFVIAYYGIPKAGGVVVAVNPTYPPDEVITPVNDANIDIMFTPTRFYNVLKAVRERSRLKRIIVSNIKEALPSFTSLLFTLLKEKKEGHHVDVLDERDLWMKNLLKKHENSPQPDCRVTPDDTALFQYSGGTTGIPKGAVAMHRNVVANTLQIRYWMPNLEEGNEVVLMGIPIVRSANTGISSITDPLGRTRLRTAIFEEAKLDGQIALTQGRTFYTRAGDLVLYVSYPMLFALLVAAWVSHRRARTGART